MVASRYESEVVDPDPFAQPLRFASSGRISKDRFLKSPMSEALASWSPTVPSDRGIPTDGLVELYRCWGKGKNSWGVIITGNINIDLESINAVGDMAIAPECLFEGDRFEKFKQIAAAEKANGSLIVGQVTHPGRQVQANINKNAISASDIQLEPKFGQICGKPYAATEDDIARIIEGFSHAAEYLYKAGFDGIELQAAHGYLLSQFLSRTTNKRTDEYGSQTVESRMRLISEIVRTIKTRVPSSFIIATKLNSVEFQEGGMTSNDAEELCDALVNLGIDFIELSGGTYEDSGSEHAKESTREREKFFVEWTEKITKSLGKDHKLKIFVAGGVRSVGAMVKALNAVDGIGLGRPAAAEPHLSIDIIEGRIHGTLKPLEVVEKDFLINMRLSLEQISQISKGKQPLRVDDAKAVQTFMAGMGDWAQ